MLRYVDDLVHFLANLECVWIHLFTDLAFELLPVEAANVSHDSFLLFLRVQPVFQALEMDKTNRTRALAWYDQRVLDCGVLAPTETT